MKKCAYCRRQNQDDAAYCTGCGTSEFVLSNSGSGTPRVEETAVPEEEVLVRDRPKLIIVVAIWLMYVPGLAANILVLILVLRGAIRGILGVFSFLVSIGGGALCVYLLRRVVKNYNIQKKRALDESVV